MTRLEKFNQVLLFVVFIVANLVAILGNVILGLVIMVVFLLFSLALAKDHNIEDIAKNMIDDDKN